MPPLVATALCLRKLRFSETSQILTLLTDRFGTVGAIAKGSLRPRSGIGGPLDLLCLYQVVLYDRSKRGALCILGQAELLDFFPAARTRYQAFQAAETVRELLLSIVVPPEDGETVLLLAVGALRDLARPGEEARALSRFAWGLLRVMGIEPVVAHCVATGREPSGRRAVSFSVGEMGLLSPPHDEGRSDLIRLAPAEVRALRALSLGDFEAQGIPVDGWRGAFRLLAWLAARPGGKHLRTVASPAP